MGFVVIRKGKACAIKQDAALVLSWSPGRALQSEGDRG